MTALIFFISCLSLGTSAFAAFKLLEIEQDMKLAKIQNDVTQEIPVRRRSEF